MPKWDQFTPGVMPHQATAPAAQDVPQVARITRVSAAGAWFTWGDFPEHAFGPAPWGLGQYATVAAAITAGYVPHVGDLALIVFAGVGADTPWVLSWTR